MRKKESQGEREWYGGDQTMMSESLSICLSVCVCVYLLSLPPSLSLLTYCKLLFNLQKKKEEQEQEGKEEEKEVEKMQKEVEEEEEKEEEILPSAEQASADKKK